MRPRCRCSSTRWRKSRHSPASSWTGTPAWPSTFARSDEDPMMPERLIFVGTTAPLSEQVFEACARQCAHAVHVTPADADLPRSPDSALVVAMITWQDLLRTRVDEVVSAIAEKVRGIDQQIARYGPILIATVPYGSFLS